MVDAGKFIMRAAHENPSLPFTEEDFRDILTKTKAQEELNSALDNPIACVLHHIAEYIKEKNCNATDDITIFEGTTKQLLMTVISKAKQLGIRKDVPKSSIALGKKLKEVSELLKPCNIEISNAKHTDKGSTITITYKNATSSENTDTEAENS